MRAHGEIAYTLAEAGVVRLTVVDVAGRVRVVLAGGARAAGRHTTRWDGRDGGGHALPAGVYLVRLEVDSRVTSRKFVIAR
jgi:flagellar hook assembly protein FlgD